MVCVLVGNLVARAHFLLVANAVCSTREVVAQPATTTVIHFALPRTPAVRLRDCRKHLVPRDLQHLLSSRGGEWMENVPFSA